MHSGISNSLYFTFLSADPLDLFQDSLIGYDLLYENHSCERAATSKARHGESVEENLVY